MKWYFASNDRSPNFFPLIKAAVTSALKNTSLKPYFIYDGKENDLTNWLKEKGVNIINHRISFYKELEEYYDEGALNIATGTFLRCDIPVLETEDDFVLYTDCDVIFNKDFDCSIRPEYFACSAQNHKHNFRDFNAGIMLINVKKMKESHDDFCNFIRNNLNKFTVFDQSAYQIYYDGKCSKLPLIYNHKPYWGINKDAVIIHFHGPKPIQFCNDDSLKYLPAPHYNLYEKNPNAYDYYLQLFKIYDEKIEYSQESISKLKKGIYPLVKYKSTLLEKIKKRLNKEFDIIKNKFKLC